MRVRGNENDGLECKSLMKIDLITGMTGQDGAYLAELRLEIRSALNIYKTGMFIFLTFGARYQMSVK